MTYAIADYYGYKVTLKDTAIGSKKMEGTLLIDDIQYVLFVLSSMLNIKIEKQENMLIFENKSNSSNTCLLMKMQVKLIA